MRKCASETAFLLHKSAIWLAVGFGTCAPVVQKCWSARHLGCCGDAFMQCYCSDPRRSVGWWCLCPCMLSATSPQRSRVPTRIWDGFFFSKFHQKTKASIFLPTLHRRNNLALPCVTKRRCLHRVDPQLQPSTMSSSLQKHFVFTLLLLVSDHSFYYQPKEDTVCTGIDR